MSDTPKSHPPRRYEWLIDALPPTNTSHRRAHWATQHKEAERWKMLLWAAGRERGTVITKPPIRLAHVTLVRATTREPDYDNLVASFKPVLDALVKIGALADDKPGNFVDGRPEYVWEPGLQGRGQVSIVVEEEWDESAQIGYERGYADGRAETWFSLKLSYSCAHCGAFAKVPAGALDGFDSGTTFTCPECGKDTVVDLFRPEERTKLYRAAGLIAKAEAPLDAKTERTDD